MIELSKKGEAAARIAAIRALGQIADRAVVPVLFEAATGEQAEVAKAAQIILAGLPNTKEIDDGILSVAENGEPKVRRVALDAVAERRIAAAVPLLLKAAGDADEQVRAAALHALGETAGLADLDALTGKLVQPKTPQEVSIAEATLGAVFKRQPDKQACAAKLLACLPQAQGASKCAALRLLGIVGVPDALQAVRAACKDANAEVKDAAIRALIAWPSAEPAADVLEIAKTSADEKYKILAFRGYITMSGSKDVPAEKKLAMCKEALALAKGPAEKKLVLAGLGETASPEAVKMIEECLTDAAVKTEAELALLKAAQGMAGTNPKEARAILNKLIASSGSIKIKQQAQSALQQIKGK
jgi:HEAT repeat protein